MRKLIVAVFIFFLLIGTVQTSFGFIRNGRINGIYSYRQLSFYEVPGGCVLRGIIQNKSKRTHMGSRITFKAYNRNGEFMGDHAISVPTISAGSSYTFEEKIIGCNAPDQFPEYLKFEVD